MEDWTSRDAAVSRLGEALERLPFDRALPGLDRLLRLADVEPSLFAVDERARKLLHEAVLARPLSTSEVVDARRAEVEVLMVEVDVLAAVVRDAGPGDEVLVATTRERLAAIRRRVAEVRGQL